MTNYKYLTSLTIDEFAEWLTTLENEPPTWAIWFDKKYCSKCESVVKYSEVVNRDMEYSFCEVNKKCRFFEGNKSVDVFDPVCLAKMWLEDEDTDEE